MCIICKNEYDEETTKIFCCPDVAVIPSLPNLTELHCDNTKITALPSLPSLTFLNCSRTKITAVPSLPKLTYLWCYNTKITALPSLPKLTYLWCYNTKITALPSLPNLTTLWCSNTKITALPSLPNLYVSCHDCPWLEQSYANKQDFQKHIEKLIKIQKHWKNKRYLQYTKNLPLHQDIIKYVLKGYLV